MLCWNGSEPMRNWPLCHPFWTVLFLCLSMALVTSQGRADSPHKALPHSLTGNWYWTSLACGSPESDAGGVYIDTAGQIDQGNGNSRCLITEWNSIPINGGTELGLWEFTASCTSPMFKASKGLAHGTITLKTMGQPGETVLFIDWRYDSASLIDPAGSSDIDIAQRCNGPRPATKYGWAMPPKK